MQFIKARKTMRFRYRGVSYNHCPFQETFPGRIEVLRYRGVYYIRETKFLNLKRTTAATPIQDNSIRLAMRYENEAEQNQRMGVLHRLYCTGWRNGSLQYLSLPQHWLFSIFLNYRRGHCEGAEWRRQHLEIQCQDK